MTAHPHRFGGTEYRLGKRELGHIHGDYLVDIPFPKKVRDEIMKKVISKDGTAIAYDQVGKGQPIILLGGIKPGTNSDRSAATR